MAQDALIREVSCIKLFLKKSSQKTQGIYTRFARVRTPTRGLIFGIYR